ncbi:hypothetical protein [Lactococcus petauri]|uniref:hypothetical protein n=1 Tax=Lactococcus petauri TaxID=1940789 RepID=UPI0022E4E93A|nr:hypothetical protein [Lactococcus petauri]
MNISIELGNIWEAIGAIGSILAVIISLVLAGSGRRNRNQDIIRQQAKRIIVSRINEKNTSNQWFYNQHFFLDNNSEYSIYDIYVIALPPNNSNKFNKINTDKIPHIYYKRIKGKDSRKGSVSLDENYFKNSEMKLATLFKDSANNIWYKSPDFKLKKISKKSFSNFENKINRSKYDNRSSIK